MKNHQDCHIEQHDQKAQLKRGGGIAFGLFLFPRANGVRHLDLAAHPGHRGEAVGNPQVDARRANGGHRSASDPADPDHIHKVIRHLDKRGQHNGQGQPGKSQEDTALPQILFFHCKKPAPFLCVRLRMEGVPSRCSAPARSGNPSP